MIVLVSLIGPVYFLSGIITLRYIDNVDQAFSHIEKSAKLETIDTDVSGVICIEGQNNAKIQDDFKHKCVYGKAKFYNIGKNENSISDRYPNLDLYATSNLYRSLLSLGWRNNQDHYHGLIKDNLMLESGFSFGNLDSEQAFSKLKQEVDLRSFVPANSALFQQTYTPKTEIDYPTLKHIIDDGNIILMISIGTVYYKL